MRDAMTPEQKLYAYLGSVADSVKADNCFRAEEDMAALRKLLKGRMDVAATETQKHFTGIADAIKKHRRK